RGDFPVTDSGIRKAMVTRSLTETAMVSRTKICPDLRARRFSVRGKDDARLILVGSILADFAGRCSEYCSKVSASEQALRSCLGCSAAFSRSLRESFRRGLYS